MSNLLIPRLNLGMTSARISYQKTLRIHAAPTRAPTQRSTDLGINGMATPVIFLKTPSPDPARDAYSQALAPPEFESHFVPVLSHTLLPDPLIKLLLTYLDPVSDRSSEPFPYGALILTSQRTVAALNAALASPVLQEKVGQQRLRELRLRLYTVGPATKNAVLDVVKKHVPECTVWGGEEAGSGEELAKLMLGVKDNGRQIYDVRDDRVNGHSNGLVQESGMGRDAAERTSQKQRRPVLFLVGETRRDIIPKMLQSSDFAPEDRIAVDEMTLYKTEELQEFEFAFAKTLAAVNVSPRPSRWTVVFSPTAGRGMLKGLGWLNAAGNRADPSKMSGRKDFVCCIGPTTKQYLQCEFGFTADVVAESPNPSSVLNGIQEYIKNLNASKPETESSRSALSFFI